MRSKKFKLEIPPFGCKIWILFGYKETFIEACKGLRLPLAISEDVVLYEPKAYKACVYYLNTQKPVLLHLVHRDNSTIMHEVHHIVEFMGRYYGFSRCVETNAYLQEWIVKQIKQKLK